MMARVKNLRNQNVVVENLEMAQTFWARLRGLLGRQEFPAGQGLLFEKTNSIHTFFMNFPIDVVFLDRNMVICSAASELKPWRLLPPVWRASYCLELPSGTLKQSDTRKGDQLYVEA